MQKKIINKGANYVLALKGNQGNLQEEIATFFDGKDFQVAIHEEVARAHGRIEIRKCWTSSDIQWLEAKKECANLQSVIKIKSTRI